MAEFRVNTNGERIGWAAAEKNQVTAFIRGVINQNQSQFQPESRRRVNDGHLFGFPSLDFDLQTLESSFGRLSVFDSSNGGGGGGGYLYPPPREIESQQYINQFQRFPFQNDPSSSVMFNNGFLNGNSREIQRFPDQSPWDSTNVGYGSGINNSPSMGSPSIVSLAKDRVSSLQLQSKIREGSNETIDMIFNEVIFHICELMVDPFGNQVILKLIEKCSSAQISQILDMVTQNIFRFVAICNDHLGTSAIKSLLSCLRSEGQISRIVETIHKVALPLTRNNHANHVILECFHKFSPLQNRILIDIVAQNCYRIAIDQFGCCMLQQCLRSGCSELKQRLIGEIITNALRLCVNNYGNYVVQLLVELNDRDVTEELIRSLRGSYAYLSRDKYGSHCVQKFLKIRDIDLRLIINDLLEDIDTLVVDAFGNYVIQTAWSVSQGDIRYRLWWHIKRNVGYMRCNKYGNKLLQRIQL